MIFVCPIALTFKYGVNLSFFTHHSDHLYGLHFLFQALNLILLTSSELSELRDLLKHSLVNPAGKDLFLSLYSSWCHSPMAIISLCLLAQARLHELVVAIDLEFVKNCPLHCSSIGHIHFPIWLDAAIHSPSSEFS